MSNFKKIFLFIFISTVLSLSIGSCAKKQGCTDTDATNYDATAEQNCCCQFSGSIVFWYGKKTSDDLILIGSKSLTYYVDGQIVGSTGVNIYWTSAPSCGQTSSITVAKNLDNAKNKTYFYRIEDETGFLIWSGYKNWTANTCLKLELAL